MRVAMGPAMRLALLATVLGALALTAVAEATAAMHPLDPAAAAGFWTPARVQAALSNDSMAHRPLAPSTGAAGASSLRVSEASSLEDRTNGRIFGVDPREGPYSCSGTSLQTPSESIVITAGHCVLDNGSWGTHIVFIPAYDHEEQPFGLFAADAVYTTWPWRQGENSDFDVAALRVEPNEFGTLTEAVGAKAWTSDRSRHSQLQIFGYPAAALGGEELRSCIGRGLGSDRLSFLSAGPPTWPARCDMAGGSSGGAWLVDNGQLIDGVTSYGYSFKRGLLYSPYFGEAIDRFLRGLP